MNHKDHKDHKENRSTCLVSGIIVVAVTAWLAAGSSDSPVADAAKQGDRETVRSLLKHGVDVNAAQGDGTTALHWAARQGNVELAQMLLYAGANVKATTRLGAYTPLLMAAETGNAAMIEALLKAGADPKSATTAGTTPLMMAAASGQADAVTALLDHGAELDAKESARGETALMFAAAFNRVDAMKVLIAHGADVTAASKVVDLAAATAAAEEAFRAQLAQQGVGVPAPDAPAAAGRGGRGFGGRGQGGPQFFRRAPLITAQGGLTPLLFAARQGYIDAAKTLVASGADVNQVSQGDKTSPLLMATINGHFDLAKHLLEQGANPNLTADNGVAPLYAALNVQWAPKALYPQPRAYAQQTVSHVDLMKALLDKGADPNARLKKKVWYSGYNFDLSGVDEIGATPFWRAAYGADVDAMKLLVASGADPTIPSMKPAGRPQTGDATGRETIEDVSGVPPVPTGGPGVPALLAAAGVGHGEGYAANSHRFAPGGMLAAVTYLVEELHVDVNIRDHEGNTALHDAAARGDNEMIRYLISKGANSMAVNREGNTVLDMANGPVQRIQPFPETVALLEKLGVKNNHKCKSC